jgi:DNA (cytosine-5)-methyltransferase 1
MIGPFPHVGLFSGIGAFDLGLGDGYQTVLAVDNDADKNAIYFQNHGHRRALKEADIAAITAADVPGRPDLVTAGFPCQDISEAGKGAGLDGARSGVFWHLARLLGSLRDEGCAPKVVLIENVSALLKRGFAAVVGALHDCGYRKIGAVVIDAADFVPQSRERVFIIAVNEDLEVPAELVGSAPVDHFTPPGLRRAVAALPEKLASCWTCWRLPVPPACDAKLIDVLDDAVVWHDRRQSEILLGQLSEISKAEIDNAGGTGVRTVFAAFRRTRPIVGPQIEIRTDGRAGCLRVASGGSSRQLVIEAEGARRRTRYLIPRECARLMAIPDSFRLPTGYAGLNACGDAVCVAVVAHLERHLLTPLLRNSRPLTADVGPASVEHGADLETQRQEP